jgi:antitoxin VapB
VSLTIDNEETCQLANELAQLTGENVTDAIAVALRERLDKEREVQERLQKIRAVSERSAKLFQESGPPPDHGDLLYDERGLPK